MMEGSILASGQHTPSCLGGRPPTGRTAGSGRWPYVISDVSVMSPNELSLLTKKVLPKTIVKTSVAAVIAASTQI